MLQFIKGDDLSKYVALMQATTSYNEAFFLDTTNTRLYYNGQPLDVRISVINEIGDDFFPKKSYQFTNADGGVTVISDAIIPELSEDNSLEFHNIETQEDTEVSNGLLGVREKFLIEAILKIFNLQVEYTYYANVYHIEDEYTRQTDVRRDVIVYEDGSGQWVYAFDEFEYTDEFGENHIKAAGTEPVEDASVHVQAVKVTRQADINYYSGGDLDDNLATIAPHGGLPAGTTVADLEKLTVSEVLSEILFYSATPQKVTDTSVYIKFASNYISTKYVDVGTLYPTTNNLEIEFIPETWQWSVNNGETVVTGEEQPLVQYESVKYYLVDLQHPWEPGHGDYDPNWNIYDLDGTAYQEHYSDHRIVEGDKSIYRAVVTYTAIANAKDSDGNETYTLNGEEVYYAQGTDGSIGSENSLRFTGAIDASTEIEAEFNVIAGWRVYSNASNTSTGSLWSYRNTEPGEFEGNDTQINSEIFAQDGSAIYLQWPSATSKSDHFYVYIPQSYSIDKIGGAHDMIVDNWDVVTTATFDSSTSITNDLGTVGVFNKYEVSKASGITTAKIELVKN